MLAHKKNEEKQINEGKIVNELRALALDMIEQAGSGHTGIALGATAILYTLYAHHLKFDPTKPDFYNRDRFIMSSGHGSALLYATLYMAGYELSLDDLKAFRRLDSITPGHPEYGKTPGVEATTGPLGEGVATAVGIAIAEKHSAALLNENKKNVIDYTVYCLCGDGDLMEGVSYEAMSLAGQVGLDNLIVLYDSNHVSLDSDTKDSFPDNIEERFSSINWEVITTSDEIENLNKAIEKAKISDKPVLIEVKTTIGKYTSIAGTSAAHGRVFHGEEISEIKESLGVRDIPFAVTNESLEDFQFLIQERNRKVIEQWNQQVETLEDEKKELLELLMKKDKAISLVDMDYEAPKDAMESLRLSSFKILNSYAKSSPLILGGAADVSNSTMTKIENSPIFSKEDYEGRNILFGVREHAMASIANGLALAGFRPFVSTYLSFSDYLKPALRLTCLMDLPVTYIFTHDSISIGQDGPTHMPVEQLVGLRATPNIDVFRPADCNEVIGSYKAVFEENHPAAIIIGRNTVPILSSSSVPLTKDGAYIVKKEERKLDAIIISTGEEVSLSLSVISLLQEKGYDIRLVSMPSMERYQSLSKEAKEELLPVGVKKIVIEKSSSYSWYNFVYNDLSLFTQNVFGKSGRKDEVDASFGFTEESLSLAIEELLK